MKRREPGELRLERPAPGTLALAECYLAPSVSAAVTSGSLTLTSDSTFTSTVTSREADGDPETENNSGTFTLDESNVIHFTPRPESDDDNPFEGTWDGGQITVKVDDDITLVFRR